VSRGKQRRTVCDHKQNIALEKRIRLREIANEQRLLEGVA
jgi:hypothetical protein